MVSGLVSGHSTHSVGNCTANLTGVGEIPLEVFGLNMHFHVVLPFMGEIITNTTAVLLAGVLSPLSQHYESFKVPRLDEIIT